MGRPNQRRRTRKDLLEAAARLTRLGRKPSLEEIAAEALVSRATAYRYFPNVDALLFEAALDIATPEPEALFRDVSETDPVARMQLVDTVLHDVVLANEAALRMVLVHSLQQAITDRPQGGTTVRQNRRMPLIEAALAPLRGRLGKERLATLGKALALIVGPEGVVVGKDVLRLDDADARRVKHWAIRALVEAAAAEARPAVGTGRAPGAGGRRGRPNGRSASRD
ncbi:TetR/AcrR family transcriptional regulator [Stella sp.]|uniref:TetR/AcrR family transcriptional regulator n=1 Tax=Stella sp. TaxID=2912054 RepID=UPI0035AE1B8D